MFATFSVTGKMKTLLIFSVTLLAIISCERNTKDPEFLNIYSVKHIQQGNGIIPKPGDLVSVHYTGTFPETGEKFDSSRDRNSPFSFNVKTGQVIQCWDDVVSRMSFGEKVYVVCPYKLAYGERGAGGVIPPNTDIAFEIEMLKSSDSKDDL